VSLSRKARNAMTLVKRAGLRGLIAEMSRRYLGIGRLPPDEMAIGFELCTGLTLPRVMVDVGAHVGGALAPFAESGWQVFAFEPDPGNRAKLQAALGSYPNVYIDARGLADAPRSNVPFYTSDVSTGISGLSAFHSSHVASGAVDVTTLDLFCREHQVDAIGCLKIDTEGYDLFVLKGGPWDRLQPGIVVCEFEDAKTAPLGYTFSDLARFLDERGYRLLVSEWHPIKQYGGVHQWRRFVEYPCEPPDSKAWGNIIAVRADLPFDALLALCQRHA
jgi:FkbM family methyltransferase